MGRKCPRTLDKPILLFGLELEDVAIVALIVGIGSLLFGPMIPGILGVGIWMLLLQFKKDKPQGYMLHWLYSKGFQMPGLIPPFNDVNEYGAYGTRNFKKLTIC